MDPNESPQPPLREGYRYAALGATFAAGIILFMAGGVLLDRWLGLTPLFTLVGTVLGAVLSFLNVYWKLRGAFGSKRRRSDEGQG